MNLYIMCGLAFSGKSTLARKIAEHTGSKRIAFDELWVEKDKEQPVPKSDEGWRFIRKVGQNVVEFTPNSDLNEFIQKLKEETSGTKIKSFFSFTLSKMTKAVSSWFTFTYPV